MYQARARVTLTPHGSVLSQSIVLILPLGEDCIKRTDGAAQLRRNDKVTSERIRFPDFRPRTSSNIHYTLVAPCRLLLSDFNVADLPISFPRFSSSQTSFPLSRALITLSFGGGRAVDYRSETAASTILRISFCCATQITIRR